MNVGDLVRHKIKNKVGDLVCFAFDQERTYVGVVIRIMYDLPDVCVLWFEDTSSPRWLSSKLLEVICEGR